jgi:hypothetical protein
MDSNQSLVSIIQRPDFKKKLAFNNQELFAYFSSRQTAKEVIDILFTNNREGGSEPETIERLMDGIKFSKTFCSILVESDSFIDFVNRFLDDYQNSANLPIYCNILKEIISKILNDFESVFLPRIQRFLGRMYEFAHIPAIKDMFLTIVNYYPGYYRFNREVNKAMYEFFVQKGAVYDYLQIIERIAARASNPRTPSPENLEALDPRIIVQLACEGENTAIKANAFDILQYIDLAEEERNRVSQQLIKSYSNTSGFIQAKIIRYTKVMPSNYITIIADPHSSTSVKQQIIANEKEIRSVGPEDILLLAEKMDQPENRHNPFIADLLAAFLTRKEFQNAHFAAIKKEADERKERRKVAYGGQKSRANINIRLPMIASYKVPKKKNVCATPELRVFSTNTWFPNSD